MSLWYIYIELLLTQYVMQSNLIYLLTLSTKDIHLDLLEGVRRALSLERNRRAVAEENFRNINEARRNFLKYIFHELRSPLNSLTIGLEVLEQSEGLNQGDFESVGVMKVATSFMGDTLNNILNIQKLEEGITRW